MSVQNEILEAMKAMAEKFAAAGVQLDLPPTSSKALGTEYVKVDMGKSLAAKFPFNPNFTNPLKMYQGGFLCAAFDDVMGPLTYMAANQPVVTLEMSTTFLRPFTAKDEFVIIEAEVVSQSKTVLVLKAEARNREGKLVATSRNHSLLVPDSNMKRS